MTISRTRLNVLRAYYALIALGTAAVFWPRLLSHDATFAAQHGAHFSLLAALSPLALLGLRHPLRMLPLVFYEFLWKALWFAFVMLPLWRDGAMTPALWSDAAACAIAIVLTPIVVPWPCVRHALARPDAAG